MPLTSCNQAQRGGRAARLRAAGGSTDSWAALGVKEPRGTSCMHRLWLTGSSSGAVWAGEGTHGVEASTRTLPTDVCGEQEPPCGFFSCRAHGGPLSAVLPSLRSF